MTRAQKQGPPHSNHLAKRHFMQASHQVLLLSTDEEIADTLGSNIGTCYAAGPSVDRSLSAPPPARVLADSNGEMSWTLFRGRHHELYMGVLKERRLCDGFGLDDEVLAMQFGLHLHRDLTNDCQMREGIAVVAGLAPA